MTIKTALVAMTLCLSPAIGFAAGCSDHKTQAQSCATGTVWDANLKSCVKQITG